MGRRPGDAIDHGWDVASFVIRGKKAPRLYGRISRSGSGGAGRWRNQFSDNVVSHEVIPHRTHHDATQNRWHRHANTVIHFAGNRQAERPSGRHHRKINRVAGNDAFA